MNIEFIPDWFLIKNLTQNERYAYAVGEKSIERETEKAVLIKVDSEWGTFKFWCPKSIVNGTYVDKFAEERQTKFEEGSKRYEEALNFAKENGLKVRNKMKLKTILNMIKNAGLVFKF